jgi:hypothetical protein
MTTTLKASGTKRLKLKHVKLLSSFAFKFDLRYYTLGTPPAGTGTSAWRDSPWAAADGGWCEAGAKTRTLFSSI